MVKITPAPYLGQLNGLTGCIIFQQGPGGAVARLHRPAPDPATAPQLQQRAAFSAARSLWNSTHQYVHSAWQGHVADLPLTGYNRWMQLNTPTWGTSQPETITPPNSDYAPALDFAFSTGAAGQINITWTANDPVSDDRVIIYYHRSGFYPYVSDVHYNVIHEAHTLSGLLPGTLYKVHAFCRNSDTLELQQSAGDVLLSGE